MTSGGNAHLLYLTVDMQGWCKNMSFTCNLMQKTSPSLTYKFVCLMTDDLTHFLFSFFFVSYGGVGNSNTFFAVYNGHGGAFLIWVSFGHLEYIIL